MGRWLKKLETIGKSELTELTQLPSVGFVSSISEPFQKNNIIELSLIKFVSECCINLSIEPQKVIDRLLSTEDEQDIINGVIPAEPLVIAIQLWIAKGAKHISGKPFKE